MIEPLAETSLDGTFFVMTGDIAGYTKVKPENAERLIWSLKLLLNSWPEAKGAQVIRGDSFQVLFTDAEAALRRALQVRCWFKRNPVDDEIMLDARIAIGAGTVDYLEETLNRSDGEAFHFSGRTLDNMKGEEFLAVVTADQQLNEICKVIFMLMEPFIGQWTRNQAEVIFMTLEGRTQEHIASNLGIGQSAVNNRLRLAKWKAVEKTLSFIASRLKGEVEAS